MRSANAFLKQNINTRLTGKAKKKKKNGGLKNITVVTANPFILFKSFSATLQVQLHPLSSKHISVNSQKITRLSR